jgi:N-acetylmuramoyl-L-alanine amidase
MLLGWTLDGQARHIGRVSFLLAMLLACLTGAPSWATTVQDIRVRADRIELRFDDRVTDASAFAIDGPRRIALDLAGTTPNGKRFAANGPVTAIRQGARGEGARVVFDLAGPAVIASGSFGDDGRTLTLRLKTVDDATFAQAAAEGRMRFLPPFSYASRAVPRPKYSVTLPVPPRPRPAALPRVYGDDETRPLVVIDAGHGGHDPGAIGTDGLREKDLTLKTALAIKDELLKSGRVRVALTREDDRFLILQERYGLARRLHANLFISIHCDSAGSDDASGATIYTLSEVASDKEAARLAARENKADIIAGVDLGEQSPDISSLLIDLTQRETMNASAAFARLLGREARPLMPMKDNFHRMASLMVLKAPDMPSVLFETGYISSPRDADFLNSAEGRRKVAESISRAVAIHFATRMAAR